MTIDRLAKEYDHQYNVLNAKIDGLRPLLYVYTGEDLYLLSKAIKGLLRYGIRVQKNFSNADALL